MTVEEKRPLEWPLLRRPASRWWLLARNEHRRVEVLTVDHGGGNTLPVFSGEGEAEMFVWLGGSFEDGWHARETSAGELVSLLCGPYADVGSVALDPSPGLPTGMVRLASMSAKGFVDRLTAPAGRTRW